MKKQFFSSIISVFLIIIILASSYSALDIQSTKLLNENNDVPTWYIGDEWVYTADPVFFSGETGSFSGIIQNFKHKVIDITDIFYDGKEIFVYEMEITGELSGEFSFEELSGDIEGEIFGTSYIRVSDLAEVKTDIYSSGIVTILFINRDYEMSHLSCFFPPMEIYDFPLNVGEQWQISSLSESSGWFILEDLMDENYSDIYMIEDTVECITEDIINVPAGSFECFNIIYESNSLWFSSDVGNLVKSVVSQTSENSSFSAEIVLDSYIRNNQPVEVSIDIIPNQAFIYSPVLISGQAINYETGEPMKNAYVVVEIPFIDGSLWTTDTNEFGEYEITIETPLFFDDTPFENEFGSFGVFVECRFGNLKGYRLKTLTVIADYPPDSPEINGPREGDIGTSYTFSFMANDSDSDDVTFLVDWGDDSPLEIVGPTNSGVTITATHTWQKPGIFLISAKTKDTFGAESESSILEVLMPRIKSLSMHFQKYSLFSNSFFQILLKLKILSCFCT